VNSEEIKAANELTRRGDRFDLRARKNSFTERGRWEMKAGPPGPSREDVISTTGRRLIANGRIFSACFSPFVEKLAQLGLDRLA